MQLTTRLDHTSFDFGDDSTPFFSGFDCEPQVAEAVASAASATESIVLIADEALDDRANRMAELIGSASGTNIITLSVQAAESAKQLAVVESLAARALEAGMSRRSAIVAFGGGLVANVAGMVAALSFRGLPFIHMPTTPIAAFDAVLSRKQAVNMHGVKNLLGMYLTPTLIAVDLAWLQTIPAPMFRTGLAEMAKNVLAVRPDLCGTYLQAVEDLEQSPSKAYAALLHIGIESKRRALALDANEKHEALVFEYGHTVGHAIEAASKGTVSHGEAVGWGLLAAADISAELSGLSADAHALHDRLVRPLGIARSHPLQLDPSDVKSMARRDNKKGYLEGSGDETPMVLISDVGVPVTSGRLPLTPVSNELLDHAIDSILRTR